MLKTKTKYRNYLEQLADMKDDRGNEFSGSHILQMFNKKMMPVYTRARHSVANLLLAEKQMKQDYPQAFKHLNVYLTLNTFKYVYHKAVRKHTNIAGLNALWSDIDLKDIGMSREDFEPLIPELLDEAELPRPTQINYTGHGFHFIWLFTHQQVVHSKKIVNRWKCAETSFNDRLNEAFFDFVPKTKDSHDLTDPKVEEDARLMRQINTWNIKGTPAMCHTVEYTGASYDMLDLCNEYIRKCDVYNAMHWNKYDKGKQTYIMSQHERREALNGIDPVTLHICTRRLKDLVSLAKLRNNEHIYSGYREYLLFFYAIFESLMDYSVKHIANDLNRVNSMFKFPKGDDAIHKILKEADSGYLKGFTYMSNGYIIRSLKITGSEQMSLGMLVGGHEQRRRHNLSRNLKNRRRSHLYGAKHKRTELIHKVVALHNNGISIRKIAKQLHIGHTSVQRYLKSN